MPGRSMISILQSVKLMKPDFLLNGFARPVAHVLVRAGELIEDGCFTAVGIAGKGNTKVIRHGVAVSCSVLYRFNQYFVSHAAPNGEA